MAEEDWPRKDLDFGHGVFGSWTGHSLGCQEPTLFGGHAGLMIVHTHPDGEECWGAISFHRCAGLGPGPTWVVECLDPLTVRPSILQRSYRKTDPPPPPGNPPKLHECLHGFIRAGRWVPA